MIQEVEKPKKTYEEHYRAFYLFGVSLLDLYQKLTSEDKVIEVIDRARREAKW